MNQIANPQLIHSSHSKFTSIHDSPFCFQKTTSHDSPKQATYCPEARVEPACIMRFSAAKFDKTKTGYWYP